MYCVITGASNGFGYEFARSFASRNYDLCICARRGNLLKELKKKLEAQYHVKVDVVVADLSTDQGIKKLYNFTRKKDVDIFINNAGIAEGGFTNVIDMALEMEMFNLNTRSMFLLARMYLKDMVARNKGKILSVSSITAWAPSPLLSTYSAGKSFVMSFTEGLNHELKTIKSRVRMSTVTPGFFNTGIAGKHVLADQHRSVPAFIDKVVNQFLKDKEIICIGQDRIVPVLCRLLPRSVIKNIFYKTILQKFPDEYEIIPYVDSSK